MITIGEARQRVFGALVPLEPVLLPVELALGCVVAEAIIATEPVPGFANSSMDGFALRSEDTSDGSVRLRVVDSILAGGGSSLQLGAGQAMRIMTGAPLPSGADCVEMIEEVVLDTNDEWVTINRSVETGMFVRRPGDDIKVGDQLVAAGDVLHATRMGVLASQGRGEVRVYPRPRVGVISTGNELTSGSGPLSSGAIRDVNRPMLLALLSDAGATPVDLGTVRDDYDETKRQLWDAVEMCDAVISTGGVSVGDVDYVKAVITELASDSACSMQVAVRPGKPFAFGVVAPRGVPIFGLPGNPVSTRVSFELFVRPAVRRLAGHEFAERFGATAIVDCAMSRSPDGKVHMVHVTALIGDDGRLHVVGVTREGSHLLHAVAGANAIAAVPDGDGLNVGETVRVIVLYPEELTASIARS